VKITGFIWLEDIDVRREKPWYDCTYQRNQNYQAMRELSHQEEPMMSELWNETFVEQQVMYIVEIDGELAIIQNVPARVNTETGERLFAPETVEKIQAILRSRQAPTKVIQAPVFEFAA
jgi:hypothetical protein